ncbi:hypothetical protein H7Y63_04185 [Polaromonas sp.]|nr:hypothetical protein [Candidatus Saccharibacteria bacterium]
MKYTYPENIDWRIKLSALAVSALAISACSPGGVDQSAEPAAPTALSPAPETPIASPLVSEAPLAPTIEKDSCTDITIPVFPHSRFKPENANSIQKQLDALRVAKTKGAPVDAGTVINASAIISNATTDNVYSRAFSNVNERPPNDIPSAEALLSQKTFMGDGSCLTANQLKEVDDLARTLVTGLAPQVGRQFSAAGSVAYDSLQRQYQEFRSKYEKELATN